MRLAKQTVQCVTELMEQGLYIVHREQRRITCRRFVEVTYIDNYRTMINALCIDVLRQDIVHPCARTFTRTREIVRVQNTY